MGCHSWKKAAQSLGDGTLRRIIHAYIVLGDFQILFQFQYSVTATEIRNDVNSFRVFFPFYINRIYKTNNMPLPTVIEKNQEHLK